MRSYLYVVYYLSLNTISVSNDNKYRNESPVVAAEVKP
jgi:hypothetical protein